ncbi:MAG TPA: hypothetical protein PKA63_09675 [Oligoflexia bacterium]|nr:hypothetical protein [Oligoflexia bacterium]
MYSIFAKHRPRFFFKYTSLVAPVALWFNLVVPEKVKNDLYNLPEDPYWSKIAPKEEKEDIDSVKRFGKNNVIDPLFQIKSTSSHKKIGGVSN